MPDFLIQEEENTVQRTLYCIFCKAINSQLRSFLNKMHNIFACFKIQLLERWMQS